MLIDVRKIPQAGIEINEKVDFDQKIYNFPGLNEVKDCTVEGQVYYDHNNELVLNLKCSGQLVLQDAIDLSPIIQLFTIEIKEKGDSIWQNNENQQNLLDIIAILWQNVLLEVPIKITKPGNKDISLQGDGWELLNEKKQKIDSRLAPLADLLEKGKD